ncbi:hypothetical protein CEXT_35841 [Caerostris extrusa]|uniref:Uncharacterized protein n=1 Tax=Caerostris extrusa TaxID=172846 RepID=A0AAV4P612_CAEEX|nr:hypothetical protein CEXT_35841 [Caerostris extrusa]
MQLIDFIVRSNVNSVLPKMSRGISPALHLLHGITIWNNPPIFLTFSSRTENFNLLLSGNFPSSDSQNAIRLAVMGFEKWGLDLITF